MTTRFGFVSPYPPTPSGLATFTAALRHALVAGGADEGIVIRLVDAAAARPGSEVVAQVIAGDQAALDKVTDHLNSCDAVIVQHDFEVYGGPDGADILPLLDRLEVPSIVVLHTVLNSPTAHQREVLEAVAAKAGAVVALTHSARGRLASGYQVDLEKVHVIPHGAPDMHTNSHMTMFRGGQYTALTWGLLRPGKGIEWALDALALLSDLPRPPRYLVAGPTHPTTKAAEGEAYRDGLNAQVRRLGLETSVSFDSHFRDAAALGQLVRSADVIVLPYDSDEATSSGVLVEAVVAGKPVIAADFPYAREILGDGAGLLVPPRDPAAIADALRTLMGANAGTATMAAAAAAASPPLLWPAVAHQYRELATQLIIASVAA